MMIRHAFLAISLLFFFPHGAVATTNQNQATVCFEQALEKAKQGTDFLSLVTTHIDSTSVAANAAQQQRRERWQSLPQQRQAAYKKAVLDYISSSTTFQTVKLESVTLSTRSGKVVGQSYELPGNFIDTRGEKHTFAFRIVVDGQVCRFVNARWNEVWLSKVVELLKPGAMRRAFYFAILLPYS